ncbi:unnamed protein product [Closterium sp. Yama58-4]|nr:unnamed protein product [Closterium sp. Yama58-4]
MRRLGMRTTVGNPWYQTTFLIWSSAGCGGSTQLWSRNIHVAAYERSIATLMPRRTLLRWQRCQPCGRVDRVENPILSSPLWQLDGAMAAGICFLLGAVLASAAARPLQRISQGKMVALQGNCPHCGEEVYSFVTLEGGSRHRHKAECHVCGQPLVFHAFVEASPSNPKHSWAYGRIYVVARAKDLEPPAEANP